MRNGKILKGFEEVKFRVMVKIWGYNKFEVNRVRLGKFRLGFRVY